MRRWIAGATVVLLLLAAAVAGTLWWLDREESRLVEALALAPGDTQRYSWTDWAGVRRELDADLSAGSSAEQVEELLTEAFDADLSATSAVVSAGGVLQERLGISPATAGWELLAQAEAGVVLLVGLPDGMGPDRAADRLAEAGYRAPEGEDRVWDGSDLLGEAEWPPELGYVAVDEEHGVLVGSDSAEHLGAVLEDTAAPDQDVVAAAEAAGEPLAAAVYTGDQACVGLAMSRADETDQAQAEELLAQAGPVSPLLGFAMAVQPGGDVLVVMSFADHDQARANADTRSRLASGPAPGQGGDFSERFTLGEVRADGPVVTMELAPTEGSYVLSDLSTGPVLFATC